ncbi:conserved hypothetical protein [Vibrio crassostreae]|uniref:hypothetical protein n=1 Tax=Vibrio lentus TaxID=136468 RepID=UPI000C82AD39|nr:hypothetical protein [Vibrio lentus]CAK1839655.1 conserved hypothetical protein [Vibrio crassostreae]PMK96883.1 hypothetical protein BCT89_10015 [Vibrio lentus]PML51285.1 hypothetical protein BCT75_11650 [Vibrio lentus]CAK1991069.1 conserved hypothetical protein [Vibrio crassostreae]CAK1996012.1 conserved hypothetical protein [Vibrio crassostreae]
MGDILTLAIELAFTGAATNKSYTLIEFGIASSIYGLLIVLLDFCTSKGTNRASSLKLTYKGWGAIGMIILWGIGAGIGGLMGSGAGIFEISRTACIFVGAGWPLILPRLISSANQELSLEKVPTE